MNKVSISVAGYEFNADPELARAVGFDCNSGRDYTGHATHRVLAALSAGNTGEKALLHAAQMALTDLETSRRFEHERKIADAEIHAARIRRQAAMLECRARGISPEIGE